MPPVSQSSSTIRAFMAVAVLMPTLALLGGCFLETPPQVSVTGLNVLALGASDMPSAQLAVDLELENPTPEPIQLEQFDYSVVVESDGERGQWSGSWSALRTLPAGQTVSLSIPAVVPYSFGDAPEEAQWQVSGTISYKAPGRLAQILFDTGFRRPRHQFGGQGTSITPPPAPVGQTERRTGT